jgi:Spy/CpxP family protein refolding chaperone
VDKIREEIKAKREEMKKNRESDKTDFENAFKQDKLDKETLKSIMKKRDAKNEEMRDFMLDELIKFHGILTPEQRTKAIEKMREMKQKMRDKHEKKGPNDKFEIPPDEK